MSNPERFYENIVIVEFRAFDRECEEHFFDSSHEQCTDYIFKKICNTAVIKRIIEYKIDSQRKIFGFAKTQE